MTSRVTVTVEHGQAHGAMADEQFAAFLSTVASKTYGSDKVEAITRIVKMGNHLTIAQVTELLKTFTYGSDMVAAVKAVKDYVVDPESAFMWEEAWPGTYSSDAEAAMKVFSG